MKTSRILIALGVLLTPILLRTLWFHQGFFIRNKPVVTPEYQAIQMPEPDRSTPVPVEEVKRSGAIVLVDIAHENLYSLSEIEPFTQAIYDLGGLLKVNTSDKDLSEALKSADAYVVIAPTYSFSDYEIQAVKDFVARGGRLLVIADPTRDYSMYGYVFGNSASMLESVNLSNQLLKPFGISFNEDYLYNQEKNEGNFRNIILEDMPEDPLTDGVTRLAFYSTHSLITDGQPLLTADKETRSSLDDMGGGLAVAATAENGNVMVFGDFNFLSQHYYQSADNQVLMKNLAWKLVRSSRNLNLMDFPHLFRRTVSLVIKKDATLDQETLDTISSLQDTLKSMNINMLLTDEPGGSTDLILMGTFDEREALKDYLTSFNLRFSGDMDEAGEETTIPEPTLEGSSPAATQEPTSQPSIGLGSKELYSPGSWIEAPGFQRLSAEGIGLVLYRSTTSQNILILLAEDNDETRGAFWSACRREPIWLRGK